MIDLHCHSNYSDGKLLPSVLLSKAIQAGVSILALTDHDTVCGSKILLDTPHSGIKLISGVELSTRWKKYDIHILGLNIDIDNEALNQLLVKQTNARLTRSLIMSERMAAIGINNAFEKACLLAGHERVGRPHFAQVLINENKVPDMTGAFKKFLTRGKPFYVPTPWVSVEDAVSHITQAGGTAVLAHPLKYRLTRMKLLELIMMFKLVGGTAMEAVSGDTTEKEMQEMLGLCHRFQLSSSTGSDFHSEGASRIFLGRQRQLPLHCMPVWHHWT